MFMICDFRIRTELGSGAWCPNGILDERSYEYLQINFTQPQMISAIETQGRYDEGKGLEFTTHYRLEYTRRGCEKWLRYKNKLNLEVGTYTYKFKYLLQIWNAFQCFSCSPVTQIQTAQCTGIWNQQYSMP